MTINEIKDGQAFFRAATQAHGALLMALVNAIDYCTEMKEQKRELNEKGKAGMERIDSLLDHEKVLKIIRPKNDPISDAEVCLLSKWGYLVCYPRVSIADYAAYGEITVLLSDMLAGGWFE